MLRLRLTLLCLAGLLAVQAAAAAITAGTLNCYFLFDPAANNHRQVTGGPTSQEVYGKKVQNLASLIVGLDVVALQEVGSAKEAADLAAATGMQYSFVQGKDTYTGQDVAVLTAPRLRVVHARRLPSLESLSKHLLVLVQDGPERYSILAVHLIRPIGKNQAKHEQQLAAIRAWLATVTGPAIVLGDFNDDDVPLLPVECLNVALDRPATHVSGRGFDHIYSTNAFSAGDVSKPPFGRKPNDLQKTLWTDHFLLVGRTQ